MNTASPQQVWFVTGSQRLYGDDVLTQVADNARAVVARLNDRSGIAVEIVQMPVQVDASGIRRLCLDARSDDSCIGVVVWMHTFSPAKEWIAGLEALGKPLLHLHTQANEALPWATIDMDFMNLNQAAHGDREFGYLETRLGLRRKTVVGHAADPLVRKRIAQWVDAARAWADASRLEVARFGDNMRSVAVTEGDKVEAQIRLGVSVNTYPVNELVTAVDTAKDDEVEALVDAYEMDYELAPELAQGGACRDSLVYAARIEAGLRGFLDEGGFGAFTTNFEDLGGLRQLPGLAVQRLMADGYGFGGEGDWKTSILVRLLKTMGAGREGGTSFMEDYTYHLGPGTPRVLGAHMLEVCPSIAGERPRCEIHPLSIGGREDPVRLVFDARPGPGIVLGLLDLGDRFRLVSNEIRIVGADEPLLRLPVARAVWEPAPSLSTSAECWLHAGGPHHTALTTAVDLDTIADFAELAGIEHVHIGADTSARTFIRELRWNDAYYRLAGRA